MISKNDLSRYEEMNQMLDSYSDREIVFLSSISYLFRIERDEDITFVDLLNDGNHGYHGKDKLLKLIKSKKDALFLVDRRELDPKKQTNKEIIQYVLDHGEKIDEVSFYELYEIKEES